MESLCTVQRPYEIGSIFPLYLRSQKKCILSKFLVLKNELSSAYECLFDLASMSSCSEWSETPKSLHKRDSAARRFSRDGLLLTPETHYDMPIRRNAYLENNWSVLPNRAAKRSLALDSPATGKRPVGNYGGAHQVLFRNSPPIPTVFAVSGIVTKDVILPRRETEGAGRTVEMDGRVPTPGSRVNQLIALVVR